MSGGKAVLKAAFVLAVFALLLYCAYVLSWYFTIPAGLFPGTLEFDRSQTYVMFPEIPVYAGCWLGSQVLPGELEATQWIKDHTQRADRFVADIPGAEVIMGMTMRVSLVGGDWANAPDPVKHMEVAGKIYSDSDAASAHDLAIQYGCDYVFLPNRRVVTGMYDGAASAVKFDDPAYFQLVYKNNDVSIYRVLP